MFVVDRSTIYRIDKTELSKLEKDYLSQVPNVDQIAIDEIGYKRRHQYATVITNHINKEFLINKLFEIINNILLKFF